jgi:hypothetical protein
MLVKDLSFWPRWQALICTDRISGFMGTGKSSSPVTTLSNRTPCFVVACWMDNEAPGWRSGRVSLGAMTSYREQGTNFNLVGTSQMVVIRETPRVARIACWSGSFPCRVYIDSSHRDTLGYE